MDNMKFTEQELEYINKDVDDQSQNVHRVFNTLNDNFYLWAELPKGTYHINNEYLSESMACVIDLKSFDVNAYTTENGVEFTLDKPTRILLYLQNIKNNVISLRKQSVLNTRKLQQESLIKKDIKTRTDYGEEYNRESMYETAREILMDGKKVVMNGKRYDNLVSIMIKDCEMEQKKYERHLEECETYQQTKDDEKTFDSLSKAMSKGKVTRKLVERVGNAIEDAKMLQQYHDYIDKYIQTLKQTTKLSIDELNNVLEFLKEYESSLLFRLNGDCITKATYKTYIITQKYIKEIEDELARRQASVSL
ncbi:MAG: hypothetical protein IJ458_04275 [Clostridia bacterium]|nr:hypothetical protein [Clostridia bacterium]MBQ8522852.1 hypothetical protein [Clostridia bacterium]